MICNQFKLSEQSTGESLKNFEIKEKDLIIADCAYGTKAEEITIYIRDSNKKLIPLRICVAKKTKKEIAAEEKRLKRLESKKQTTYSEDTKFTHQFMFVITSLPASVCAEKVLEFYRLRWQAELVFKRYKSLLGLGNIPTKTKESSEVWLNGKMFLALLYRKISWRF